ncbi:MAG: SUMF1/EgtB/PvdO family nonheme iron enzyme [Victivallales bacterium]|nr:SUMF1/EgtB/PvdO family nonheme iron enzyme [Victivallales bacterium]
MDEDTERTIVGAETAYFTDSEATLRDSRQRFRAGDVILGQYEVLEELGQGGMGVVYRCMDRVSGTEVAVKALPPELSHSAESMEDIRDNFQLVHSLIHQNIAACLSLAKDKNTGDYYLVMEMVAGKSLALWIRARRRESSLSLEAALPILRQVAVALDFAHGKRVMHRDVKPANIMVEDDGTVKVLDFGIAAQIRSSMTRVSMAFTEQSGTRLYKAPEQWRSRPQGAATDQYALAVTAYEMLSGRLPFDDDDPAVLREMVLKEKPLPIEGIPDGANNALLRALGKDPKERFGSCEDFVQALGGEKKSGGSVKRRERTEASGEEALINELLMTKVRIKRIREAFDGDKLDRGQTFGEHLDEFRDKCEAGDAAFDSRLYSNARHLYDEALAAHRWIEESTPLRTKASSAMAEARSAREKALDDVNDVRVRALSQYDDAERTLQSGERSYEAGSFEEADKEFRSASLCFSNVIQTARKEHFRELEESAQTAAKSGKEADWRRVLVLAEEMKPIDSVAAKKWHVEAEANLMSSLMLKATVNGREVEACVDGRADKTPLVLKKLRKGDTLAIRMTYEGEDGIYIGTVNLTVDWNGEKNIAVPLRNFTSTVSLPGDVKLELVKVEKGDFMMGSPSTDNDRDSDETQHRVYITRDFWLGKYEVTQEQYQAVMGGNPSFFDCDDRYPVECVSWYQAMEFCYRLTDRERAAGLLPEGYEYTLPTEAQWEYAAHGGNKSMGYKYSGSDNLDEVGWYVDNSGGFGGKTTHPVGEKAPNELGLYDMSGNVREWCRDHCEWKSEVMSDTYCDDVRDPLCSSGARCVNRGGDWGLSARLCRVASRCCSDPATCRSSIGFRVALAPSLVFLDSSEHPVSSSDLLSREDTKERQLQKDNAKDEILKQTEQMDTIKNESHLRGCLLLAMCFIFILVGVVVAVRGGLIGGAIYILIGLFTFLVWFYYYDSNEIKERAIASKNKTRRDKT